jgi:phospholipid-binding lipoprotein MlaA
LTRCIRHRARIDRRRRAASAALAAALLFAAPARGDDTPARPPEPSPVDDPALFEALDAADAVPGYPDPWEEGNRGILGMNEFLDRWMFAPVTKGYRWITPDPAERCVARFFRNLGEPISFLNHALQLEPKPAGKNLLRFGINSTLGIGGLFDIASREGVGEEPTDFGETLHRYGTPSGPYLMLPVLGPSTARDAFGTVFDSIVSPQVYLLGGAQQVVLGTGAGVNARSQRGDQLDALRASSVDFYAALRAAYYLSRESELGGAAPAGTDSASATLRSSAERSASNPSRSSTAEYSERRSASSDTVPRR